MRFWFAVVFKKWWVKVLLSRHHLGPPCWIRRHKNVQQKPVACAVGLFSPDSSWHLTRYSRGLHCKYPGKYSLDWKQFHSSFWYVRISRFLLVNLWVSNNQGYDFYVDHGRNYDCKTTSENAGKICLVELFTIDHLILHILNILIDHHFFFLSALNYPFG